MKSTDLLTHNFYLPLTKTKQVRPDKPFRLGIGSFVEEYSNKVEIVSLDSENGAFPPTPTHSFTHPYPCTKIMFVPDKDGTLDDLVATTGDYLRIWHINDDGVELKSLLNNNKNSEFCAPLTSFDWNDANPVLSSAMAAPGVGEKRAEIYTYEAPWLIYALGWSVRIPDDVKH